jgi:uncharacterized OsmC-like protein
MSTQIDRRPNETFNGFDTRAMGETIGAIQRNRSLARFEFRAANQWLGGGMNRSSIQGFFGAGAEDKSRAQPFKLVAGEPPVLLGQNEGPNPGEYLLHAIAGCITTTTVLHAAARGIRIESMSSEVSGDVDLQGLLDFDKSVPAGFRQITVRVKIEADCSDAELDELLAFVRTHSPVADTVSRPVPVTLERVAP